MIDREAQANAWIRKKPKRIIHNQALLIVLACLLGISSLPLGMCVFWLIFILAPAVVIPSALFVWFISSLAYIIARFYYREK